MKRFEGALAKVEAGVETLSPKLVAGAKAAQTGRRRRATENFIVYIRRFEAWGRDVMCLN